MGKRYFVAVYTDSGCIVSCGHKHQNVATATACVSQAGGYVVAIRRRKYLPLTQAEEAEYQQLMFGAAKSRSTVDSCAGLVPHPRPQ